MNTSTTTKIPSYDQFVLAHARDNAATEALYEAFLAQCLKELQQKANQLIAGELVYLIIPTAVPLSVAERIASEFNQAGGWSCAVHDAIDEPWIEFKKAIA
ncbi:MAG: hypothetical protein SFV17_08150 [Candidatus Obscuribacter sp.]|nr:hypothetical protein [Candidatus Melainabacteria bacterium]MDX1986644.1 hypothetical protein [Candidatus Obscuribacter sp.]